MAAEGRRARSRIERELREEAYRFDFFQAVRLLAQLTPDGKDVGGTANPSEEFVRFRSHLSLDFPASAIDEIAPPQKRSRGPEIRKPPLEMTVNFMGLTGPLGVLPRHYTNLVLDRVSKRDTALRDFLDLFNHRLISLFYRAWRKHHFAVPYERMLRVRRAEQADEERRERDELYDAFTLDLFSLFGFRSARIRKLLPVNSRELPFYAGLFAQRPRSAAALRGFLLEYFQAPLSVEQFRGMWIDLGPGDRTELGRQNSELGVSTVAGSRVWDQQAKFRLRIGALGLVRFREFLPSGGAFPKLVLLTRLFVGQELDFDVQLILRAADVPTCRLPRAGDSAGPQLGWTSWLKTGELEADPDDVIIRSAETLAGAFPS